MAALDFNRVLQAHALASAVVGSTLLLMPHRTFGALFDGPGEGYSHLAHELSRCYGALTLATAWLAYRTRSITDARVRRVLAESYSLCYGVTAVVLFRAFFAAPSLHGVLGLLVAITAAALSVFYGFFRFIRKIKGFELPGARHDGDL